MSLPIGLVVVRALIQRLTAGWLIACSATSAQTLHAQPLTEVSGAYGSRYQRTVLNLQWETPEVQGEFASSALAELAEVYMAEADLARKQAVLGQGNPKLRSWSYAVDQYANQLSFVLDDIELGMPVTLRVSRQKSVTVSVADRAVMLNHPRADQQAAFEQRILQDFCGRQDCKSLTVESPSSEPIPVSASQVSPQWLFSENSAVCSHDGIQVSFAGNRNLARYRATCQQLLQEMSTLATELAWQQRHGVVVDWDNLMISPTPGRPEHLVKLNRAGDSILATLPLIYHSQGLLADITPWLQQRFNKPEPKVVQLEASHYGWERAP
jgi:hypothetical protein